MGMTMNEDKIKALAAELAKDIKTPEDLSAFSAQLTKITVEAALCAELEAHLGYASHAPQGRQSSNSRTAIPRKSSKVRMAKSRSIRPVIATPVLSRRSSVKAKHGLPAWMIRS